MLCENSVCSNEVVGRRAGAKYCCPNCKRQAEVSRRAVKKKGTTPEHRGPNTGRSLDKRTAALRTKYGITPEQYEELLEKQNHQCAVCQKHKDEFRTRLAVDHSHATGEIRGLLCYYCNYRLVGRWKSPELLRLIADYIEQGTGWFVPDKMKSGEKRRRKKKHDK